MRFDTYIHEMTSHGMPAALSLAVLLMLSRPASGAAPEAASNKAAPADLFKQFIENPPVIRRLAAKQRIGRHVEGESVPALSTNEFRYMTLARQPGAFKLHSSLNPSETELGALKGGMDILWSTNWWVLNGAKRTAVYTPLAPEALLDFRRSSASLNSTKRLIGEILNFGIFHVFPQSIHWTSDTFETEAALTPETMTVRGRLHRSPSGYAESLDLMCQTSVTIARYVIRYDYASNRPAAFLPSRVSTFYINAGVEVQVAETIHLELETGDHPQSAAVFDPLEMIKRESLTERLFVDNNLHQRNALGEWAPMLAGAAPAPSSATLRGRHYYYVALIAVAFIFSLIMVREKSETAV